MIENLKSIFKRVSNLGIKEDMSLSVKRQIELSNKIGASLGTVVFIVFVYAIWWMPEGNLMHLFLESMLFFLVLVFNYFHYTYLSRLTIALGTYLFILVSSIMQLTVLQGSVFGLTLKTCYDFMLATSPILSMLLFDPVLEKRKYWFNLLILLINLLVFEHLSDTIIPGLRAEEMPLDNTLLLIIELVLWFSIVFVVTYSRRVNSAFENNLNKKNQDLQFQKEMIDAQNNAIQEVNQEMLTQNEELRQQQEEIIAQREFIELKNKDLENQQRMTESSVRAARTIQKAILPYASKMDKLLKDYFVMNKPKDIVSGDFFWLNEVDGKNVLVVADCTGHGIPGAFVTMIGNTLLDKIVRVWKVLEPGEVLNSLSEDLKIMLTQNETTEAYGMDMIVVVWEVIGDVIKINFGGAKNKLWYVDSEGALKVLKGDKTSIGTDKGKDFKFSTQTVELPIGTTFYASTDGFGDQNNSEGKKYGSKRLMDKLVSICHEPLDEQYENLRRELRGFMDVPQRDDILLLGWKVSK